MKTLLTALGFAFVAFAAQSKDVIIDVRSPQEFATGHVEGAINIEHTAIAQEIAKAGVSKDDTVLLYCQSGRRSGIALETLKGLGFSKAENVGGIEQARKTLAKK